MNITAAFLCGIAFALGGAIVVLMFGAVMCFFKGDDEKAKLKREAFESVILSKWDTNNMISASKDKHLLMLVAAVEKLTKEKI